MAGALSGGLAAADSLRDPFVFGPGDPQGDPASQVLIGVFWDAQKPIAIIGERSVVAGELIGEWELVEILPEGVVVQRGLRRVLVEPGQALPGD